MKLWEALKAFEEGQEVQYKYTSEATLWVDLPKHDSFNINHTDNGNYTFRIKPKPFECWVNQYSRGTTYAHGTKQLAEIASNGALDVIRIAVHMREVTE